MKCWQWLAAVSLMTYLPLGLACSDGHGTNNVISSSTVKQLTIKDTGQAMVLKCPPGQQCDARADYHALQYAKDGLEVYLSFSASVNRDYRSPSMQKNFRFADFYLPSGGEGDINLHVEMLDKQIEFLPAPQGLLRLRVRAPIYKMVSQGDGKSPNCRTDDMVGVCQQEVLHRQPIDLTMELKLPAS
ncbi:hypothetical protein [Chitinivorax sp. B]|uniref:hypothetical protein n=1 Tax=Chitinivorax sp. B TaxID=2502235 RepID=UPI0010F6F714|nr:hypothetical protein [Chitinivorax sp. B]